MYEKNDFNKKINRQTNLELLRIVLTMFVLTVHYNCNGVTGGVFSFVTLDSNKEILFLLESFACIGVNGFVLITGYFSYKNKKVTLTKVFILLSWVVFYNCLAYLINVLFGKASIDIFSILKNFVPVNWYVILYCTLILISPYLNLVIENLSRKNMKIFVCLCICVFSIWNTIWNTISTKMSLEASGISTVGISGDQAGYTIVNFIMLYIIGAAINKWNYFDWKKRYDILGYSLCSFLIWFGIEKKITTWDYSNILVIVSAILFFNFFRKWKVEQIKGIRYISKYCFGVYLIHTKAIIQDDFWNLFNVQKNCSIGGIYMIANWIICIMTTFIFCVLVDCVCHILMKPIIKIENVLLKRLDFVINE